MTYVDGFVLPLPKSKLDVYRKLARKASKVWIEHGALEYHECVGEDLKIAGFPSFLDAAGAKRNETVIFAWIVYKTRAHRDRVNKKLMADPRMASLAPGNLPFDVTRMAYGGFKTLVEAFGED